MPGAFDRFTDPGLAGRIIGRIRELHRKIPGSNPVPLMEVCGTHSHLLGKSGIRDLLADVVEYRSGPGCPVCVTALNDLDALIDFSLRENIILVIFGDLLKVPGTRGSLQEQKARGARIKLVYSILDVLELARQNRNAEVVFVGAGFETTAPGTALLIKEARAAALKNLSVFSLHKLMPPVLRQLLGSGRSDIRGLILPGHVAAVTGRRVFDFIASELGCPAVVAGFEPLDVLHATALLLEMAAGRSPAVINGYPRVVSETGNTAALAAINGVFTPVEANWRGFGCIEGSGLGIKEEYSEFDASRRFGITPLDSAAPWQSKCRCSEILRGELAPRDCPLFGTGCTPDHPQGACMVSGEGACSSYF